MRPGRRTIAAVTLIAAACAHGDESRVAAAVTAKPAPAAVVSSRSGTATADFARDVQPILARRCQPCHFAGGVMYSALPFDQEKTVHTLGTKLFTRIKDPKEQAAIRALLDRGPGG